jgi:predicted nucleic acid-binding protein
MQVVLDSSVIVEGDWNLAQNAAQALLGACGRGVVELFVPQVVVNEVISAYQEREEGRLEKLNRARADLRKMRGSRADSGDLEGDLSAKPGYITHLTQTIKAAGGEILDFPDVGHRELVERALQRHPPFDSSGQRGYRDALIWHNVLDVARSGNMVVFVTNDSDFRETEGGNTLHRRLAKDLQQRGIDPDRVSLAASIAEVVEQVLEPAESILDALNGQLEGDPDRDRELAEALVKAAAEQGAYADVSQVEILFDVEEESFADDVIEEQLDDIDDFLRYGIVDAVPLAGQRFGIEVWVDAVAFFNVTVSTSSFSGQAGIPSGVHLSADETSAELGGSAAVRLVYEVEYDQASANLGLPRLVRVLDRPDEADLVQGSPTPSRNRPRLRRVRWIPIKKEGGDQ